MGIARVRLDWPVRRRTAGGVTTVSSNLSITNAQKPCFHREPPISIFLISSERADFAHVVHLGAGVTTTRFKTTDVVLRDQAQGPHGYAQAQAVKNGGQVARCMDIDVATAVARRMSGHQRHHLRSGDTGRTA